MIMNPYIGLLSALVLLSAGCAKSIEPTSPAQTNTVSVNVHGVNYTADPFRYVLIDAANSSVGTAEHIAPFSGGGIMCCFTLPKQWRPGIRVTVQSTHWLSKTNGSDLTEIEKNYTVDVPIYPEGAGELWVLRTANGAIELVTSNVEPDHPKWPGKVKGWPEPSLAYRRERWKLHRDLAEYDVKIFRNSLEKFRTRRSDYLQETWDLQKEHDRFAIKDFSGPSDPAYAEYQKKTIVHGLRYSEKNLEMLLREKP